MIGKIIGAGLGAKLAENTSKIGGPMAAVLGATAPVILKRLSLPAMVALAAGGYAVKKLSEKKTEEQGNTPVAPKVQPSAT